MLSIGSALRQRCSPTGQKKSTDKQIRVAGLTPALVSVHPRCQPPSLPQRSWSLSFRPSFCLASFCLAFFCLAFFCLASFFWLFFDDPVTFPLSPETPRWCSFRSRSTSSPRRPELPVAANRLYGSSFEAKRLIGDRGFSMESWARSDPSVSLTGRFWLFLRWGVRTRMQS